MKKVTIVCAALTISVMLVRCNSNNAPTALPDKIPGTVLLSEGFEGDLSNYKQIVYDGAEGLMTIDSSSKAHVHLGKGSLTSDSNSTSIKCRLDPTIDDSIAGLQFYIMATKKSQTDMIVALCRPGSSANGLFSIFGLGIGKSDSLMYVFENAPADPINEHKSFAPFTLNKWYKCKVEYGYADTTLSFFVDDRLVYKRGAPSPVTLQYFVVMRDGLGTQGPSGYYVDDVAIYKR